MRKGLNVVWGIVMIAGLVATACAAEGGKSRFGVDRAKMEWWKPYLPPCTERENVFAFTEKPAVKFIGKDKYEITFVVKGYCDVTVAIVDPAKDVSGLGRGTVVRHLGSGVLGPNAPGPFQKSSLKQTIYWNGKDDLDYYPKESEKLCVRVMLGLKPVFDKRLGGTSPHNIPGHTLAIGGDKDGMYVLVKGGKGRVFLRKFGHDGEYVCSLTPPPANLPESKLKGMGYVEYEPGKKAIHAPHAYTSIAHNGRYIPMMGGMPKSCRLAVVNGRIYYTNAGGEQIPSYLYYVNTDGSTDLAGCADRPFLPMETGRYGIHQIHLAASPDGKWIYEVHTGSAKIPTGMVWRCATDDQKPAEPFVGKPGQPGSDNESLSNPRSVNCDSQGRVYVCDTINQRIQVFSPEGKHVKTLKVPSPAWVAVHRKTGEVYVMHPARVRGGSVPRLAKYSAFPEMKKLFHVDGIVCTVVTLDSWSDRPRIWTAGGMETGSDIGTVVPEHAKKSVWCLDDHYSVRVWEERDGTFRKVFDFEEEAKKHDGENYIGRWTGSIRNRVVCDPSREHVFLTPTLRGAFRFDIPSGRLLEYFRYPVSSDDIALDKRGYLHMHFNPGGNRDRGVGRVDPGRVTGSRHQSENEDLKHLKIVTYPEVPYDYGIPAPRSKLLGILPVKDQPGAKWFQDGFGVNMQGDVAEECNIYYVSKGFDIRADGALGLPAGNHPRGKYGVVRRMYLEMTKRGEQWYSIRRTPGVPLSGGTIWTFDRSGELRDECAVIAGRLINGVQIDEDGKLYFTITRQPIRDGKLFLAGKMGVIGGAPVKNPNPHIGTYIKSVRKGVRAVMKRGYGVGVPLDEEPDRPPEVAGGWMKKDGKPYERCWIRGAEWLYAGASPIVVQQPCSCYTMRCGLDWYKRSYVLEQHRHAMAVLDTNGNLVMHLGQYGNLDSGDGAESKIPVGGDNIVMSFVEYVSVTDNYLCYDDFGERLAVVKLDYHAEETVPIGTE